MSETPDLYHDDEGWAAYEAKGVRRRKARWVFVFACWVFSREAAMNRRLASMGVHELVDLASTLESLGFEVDAESSVRNAVPPEHPR